MIDGEQEGGRCRHPAGIMLRVVVYPAFAY